MRIRLALTFLVIGLHALVAAAPVFADTFPDLPGMKGAEKAIAGKSGQSNTSGSQTTTQNAKQAPAQDSATLIRKAVTSEEIKPILEMPGGKSVPIISDPSLNLSVARRVVDAMPRGLTALAAIGTLLSVGGFLLLRDRLPER